MVLQNKLNIPNLYKHISICSHLIGVGSLSYLIKYLYSFFSIL